MVESAVGFFFFVDCGVGVSLFFCGLGGRVFRFIG